MNNKTGLCTRDLFYLEVCSAGLCPTAAGCGVHIWGISLRGPHPTVWITLCLSCTPTPSHNRDTAGWGRWGRSLVRTQDSSRRGECSAPRLLPAFGFVTRTLPVGCSSSRLWQGQLLTSVTEANAISSPTRSVSGPKGFAGVCHGVCRAGREEVRTPSPVHRGKRAHVQDYCLPTA